MNASRTQGFTLLEMLISIAIVAMIAITVYQVNSNAIRQQQRLEDFTLGHMILMNSVEQYQLDVKLGEQEIRPEERIRFVHEDEEFEIKITRTTGEIEGIDQVNFVLSRIDPNNDSRQQMEEITTYMRKGQRVDSVSL
ncbi:MAG: prepilin-type N-terminal cleavage/methylation domain-containing protein [Gammaproteobacteria bacterium]|nr:prepilin-type N-terminal cleavage/methylation domain-containing protein [Gammaproteobacteria bacterium]MXX94217.1 prepilin-type N-terminal cleavage/methylation domain-containing protein [Gammaproteobacteria bacterium]MYF52532.1 prepilin-type N-terminal cleavage/methylation domain-containing protein [Gammaproteobacteria bacterium]MYK44376.1 prepilin-type N-terminal cleavage/methylation domain-containing protein [Gammaproteobacteria bacterium]